MAEQILITGARVFVYINGKKFGRCTSFSWTSETMHREIEGIDSLSPYELAPTRQRVRMQIGMLRVANDGGLQGTGMIPRGEQLPRGQYFTLALVDRKTGSTIFRSDFNAVDTEQWQVAAKGIMQGTASLKGLTWSNEVVPAA